MRREGVGEQRLLSYYVGHFDSGQTCDSRLIWKKLLATLPHPGIRPIQWKKFGFWSIEEAFNWRFIDRKRFHDTVFMPQISIHGCFDISVASIVAWSNVAIRTKEATSVDSGKRTVTIGALPVLHFRPKLINDTLQKENKVKRRTGIIMGRWVSIIQRSQTILKPLILSNISTVALTACGRSYCPT